MTKNNIDHVQDGWALLALRLPEIRAFSGVAHHIAELYESYSFAILWIDTLDPSAVVPMGVVGETIHACIRRALTTFFLHYSGR
jgi:hypothetical protein